MAHVAEYKKEIVANIEKLISSYPIIGAVNMENLPAPQLQIMRAQLRGKVELAMTKRRLIKIAIENCKDKKKGIEKLGPYLKGMPALIFTKDNPFVLFKILKKSKSNAPAKAGQTAPKDIVVKAGPTSFAPGPIIGELGAIGIKCGVEGGKVAIKQDSVVVKEGEKIGAKQAEILTRLGIEPMEVGLDLTATYENGTIFTKDVLDIDEVEFMNKLENAAKWAVNLSVYAAYPTKDNIKMLIGKAFNDAKAIGIEQNIIDEDIIDELLGKAERQMQSLKLTANIPVEEKKVEAPPEVKKEEVKIEAPKVKEKGEERIAKKEEKVLEEEEKIIEEEEKLEKEEAKPKIEAPVEKEVEEEVKKEEEKQLEKERIEKEKEFEKLEKKKEEAKEPSTDDKVANMVKKMQQFIARAEPTAEKIVEEIEEEDKKIELKEKKAEEEVPSAHDLIKKKKEDEHKKAEKLAQELIKKGSLRK